MYYLVRDTVAGFAERPVYWVKADGQNFSAVSYFNWRGDMKRFQAYLVHRMKVEHGDRIGLLCDNRYEWNLLSLGITTIGAIDVPRGCDATSQDVLYILNHTECKTLIVEHEKMLRTIVDLLPQLPHLTTIISIESQNRYKKLSEWQAKFEEKKIQLLFLVDMIAEGEEIIEQYGEKEIRRRGEAIRSSDIATIIYTSGTTGTPKGVMLEHRSFCWEVEQLRQILPMGESDRCVIFLPPWHIAERLLEVALLSVGSSMANSSILTLAGDLTAIRPTVLVSVPRVWEQLYKRVFDNVRKQPEKRQKLFNFARNVAQLHSDVIDTLLDRFAESEIMSSKDRTLRKGIAYALYPFVSFLNVPAQIILKKVKDIFGGRLRFAVSGAGALPEHVALFFRSIGIPILDGYGMTETTGVSVMGRLPWPQRGAVGKPIPGCQIQLRDETNKAVTRPGIKGVAWHKGPHIMRGYYKMQDKTDEILKDGWLNSGDIFVWTTTGEIKFSGRAKDTIVLAGGENVEPGPIEMQLTSDDFIAQAVVAGQDKKTLTALIVPNWDRSKEEFRNKGMEFSEDYSTWNSNPAIRKFFNEIVKKQVSIDLGFKAFEKLSGFHIMHKDFEKGKEMTETMKIKRNVVFDLYKSEIDAMYKD